jgi:hypothetical protein
MKNYRTWIIAAIIFQILTGLMHSISFIIPMQATDESEKMLVELFTTQQLDLGSGFHRTLYDIFKSVSVSVTLLFVFGGLLNWYLLRKKASTQLINGILTLQVFIFGVCFVVMLKFAFLVPIVLTGMSFLTLVLTRIAMPRPIPSKVNIS